MSAPPASQRNAIGDLWNSRELLRNLVSKELKVRYKHSALGFLWSLVTPLLMTAVFTVVFATFLRIPLGEGNFATFFLAGYLVWQFFSNSVNASVGAIVGNGALIQKVYFPREVIPLSQVLFLAWFYATPVIYPLYLVEGGSAQRFRPFVLANPMTSFVEFFHHSLYGLAREVGVNPPPQLPGLRLWLACTAWAVAALVFGTWLFRRKASTFAKEV